MTPIRYFRWFTRILGAVLLVFTFTLSGCLSKPPLNVQTFAFTAPVSSATSESESSRVLAIKSLQITPPFDGRSFVYRSGEFRYERDPYAGFLGPPAEQLAALARAIFGENPGFSDVVAAGSATPPDVSVDITITQLYGDIRKPNAPFAVLAMRVTLLEVTNGLPGRLILHRNYSRRIPITSTAPAALMAGWNRALIEIIAEVASDFPITLSQDKAAENVAAINHKNDLE